MQLKTLFLVCLIGIMVFPSIVLAQKSNIFVNDTTSQIERLNLREYPNPSSGRIYIEGLDKIKIDRIEIYNMQGRRLKRLSASFAEMYKIIDLSTLPKGYYFLRYIREEQIVIMRKISLY